MSKKPEVSVYADLCKEKQELREKNDALNLAIKILEDRMEENYARIREIHQCQNEIKELVMKDGK